MRKTLKELTFKDNFLFAATMLESDNCKLRSRYYHAQMDMELIGTGVDYEELPETYVIFICDFDPIGLDKYRYTIQSAITEDVNALYQDGVHTILLNTKGKNEDEVPKELVSFLKFVESDGQDSMNDYGDSLVKTLQTSISKIKSSREMEDRYMTLEQLIKDERKEAKAEGRAEGRAEGIVKGIVDNIFLVLKNNEALSEALTDEMLEKISSVKDLNILKELLVLSMKATEISEIEQKLYSDENSNEE